MGIRGRAGEGGLWGRAAYNESEKVVEKGRFTRHLPDNRWRNFKRGSMWRGDRVGMSPDSAHIRLSRI